MSSLSPLPCLRALGALPFAALLGCAEPVVSDLEWLERELVDVYGHPVRVSLDRDSTLTVAYEDGRWWVRNPVTGRRAARHIAWTARERFPGIDSVVRVRVELVTAVRSRADSLATPVRYAWPVHDLNSAAATDPAEGMLLRHVLLLGDTLRLGEPLADPDRYHLSELDSVIVFPTGSFAGASGLVAYRRPTGEVYRVAFLYGPERNIDTVLAEYRHRLGRPGDSARVKRKEGLEETWVWRDRRTTFSLLRFTPPHGDLVGMAWMLDRTRYRRR